MTDDGRYLLSVVSPRGHGASLYVRSRTNDAATVHSTFWAPNGILHDEYELAKLHLTGWALDIGAHVGSVALALAIDNPDLKVIAVEAVPENAALLQASVEYLALTERVFVISASAGQEGQDFDYIRYGYYDVPGIPEEHAEQVRYIGGLFREHSLSEITLQVPVVSLEAIRARFGVDRFSFCKIDCEGCEWAFLATPAVESIDLFIGEFHDRGFGPLGALLGKTHDVEITKPSADEGIGLFRATRR